jgi:hypothetical protein
MNSFGIAPPTIAFSKTNPCRSPRVDPDLDVAVLARRPLWRM